ESLQASSMSMFPSSTYPVVFKCSECTLVFHNLEQLESHIWNRHLGAFPYYCAKCNYPALTEKGLTSHFYSAHPGNDKPEFKRPIETESQLRYLITQSICVDVSMCADDSAGIYDDNAGQEDLGDVEALPPAEQGQFVMEQSGYGHNLRRRGSRQNKNVEDADHDHPPNLKRMEDDPEIIYLNSMEAGMAGQDSQDEMQEGVEIIEEGVVDEIGEEVEMVEAMMENDHPGNQHVYDEYGYDDEGTMYEDGDVEWVENGEYPEYYDNMHAGGDRSDLHSRMMKNRHMEMIVSKIAGNSNLRKKPATEIYCDICDKHLKYPSRIAAHRRMHTQEKAFECPHCNKSFSQKSSLNVHIRSHTGDKPFACSWECGKLFTSSSALKMHEKTHSGERNYPCTICGQLFSKRSHAVRHEKTRHSRIINEEEMDAVVDMSVEAGGPEKAVVDEVVESVRSEKFEKNYMKQHRLAVKREERDISLHDSV
ncbi:hypothetical protein PMAYCL1PPCAC_23430, partial [Pristionchus mayeri]